MMDEISQIGIDTFAEEMAKGVTEEPDKQILIAEGLKRIWSQKYASAHTPVLPTLGRYFLKKNAQGILTLYDFQTLLIYMESVRFDQTGCAFKNARTGETTVLGPVAANALYEYLTQYVPALKQEKSPVADEDSLNNF